MDNRQGMTIEPTLSYTEDGQEYVSDFNAFNTFEGGEFYPPTKDEYSRFADEYDPNEDPDFFEDPDSESEYLDAIESQYIEDLFDAHGSLQDAIDWAASGGLADELIEDYNEAIDSGDFDLINEAIERLMQFYFEQTGVEESEEYELDMSYDQPTPDLDDGLDGMDTADILLANDVSEEDLLEALRRLRDY